MAKNSNWTDDYWLLVMQLYLRKPVGVKPMYCRKAVDLSLELHVPPQVIHARMCDVANLETPRIERIWQTYAGYPQRLARAVKLLRSMTGFNNASQFYDGVDVLETFERDFRPVSPDTALTPVMLVLTLDLYFQLTPITMVGETPEVQQLASLIRRPVAEVVDVLDVFQHCDPYLNRKKTVSSPLLGPCQQVWQRYANDGTGQLADYANQLKEYFR